LQLQLPFPLFSTFHPSKYTLPGVKEQERWRALTGVVEGWQAFAKAGSFVFSHFRLFLPLGKACFLQLEAV